MSAQLAWATEADPFAMAQDEFQQLVAYLRKGEGRDLSHEKLEEALRERGRELQRLLFQAQVDSRGPGPAALPVCGADGVLRKVERLHQRRLLTVFGEVWIKRLGYGTPGELSLHPLDAELNLPVETYSLGVRRVVAEQAAQVSFDATGEAVENHTGTRVGKRQIEELAQRATADFDAFYAQRTALAGVPDSSILAMSVDGKGVVMLPRDLREPTRTAAQSTSNKLTKRLTKGEKKNRKRMATVAAVYSVAPYVRTPNQIARSMAPIFEAVPSRPPVEHKRVWASLQQTPQEVIGEAFCEALRRDPQRQKTWVALVDGNATQLKILESLAREHQVALTIVMDVMHVTEYLWKASVAFTEEASAEREQWVAERLHNVLLGKAALVAAGMRRSATLRGLSEKEREPVETTAKYLLNHKDYLRYDEYLAAGLPIATGVIEGACRHLVCDRMDGAARWSLAGAEAVLCLRALRSSDDLDAYWRFHVAQEYQRNHVAQYANGDVVPVKVRSPSALRVVR